MNSQAVLDRAESSARLLDVQAVAEMLGCSPRHVYRMTDVGRLPKNVKLGALVRWSKPAIEEWIAAGCPSVRQMKGGTR
jgi:excisionase family DNA binding protein